MTELKRMGGAEIYADHDPRWPSSDAADPPWRLRPQMHLVWHRSDAQNTPGPGPQNRRSGGLITSSAPAEASTGTRGSGDIDEPSAVTDELARSATTHSQRSMRRTLA
jgi:hypothetical protein